MELASLLSSEPANPDKQAPAGKTVTFEHLLDGTSKTRARLPLKAEVRPQDSLESITTTVKNFYGIPDGFGVSFEDVRGATLIATYDNLVHDMVIYVRTVVGPTNSLPATSYPHYQHIMGADYPRRPSLGEPFQMLPPHIYDHPGSPSRPNSRTARKRSASPHHGRGRRSASQQKAGSVSAASRGSSANGSYHDDAMNAYSDSEAGRSSIAGSRKARSEQFASAEISQENIMQDGRRPKALFDSSELPLFAPPQIPIPTSTSSISPQRRTLPQDGVSPFHPPAQVLYGYENQTMQSPQAYGHYSYRNGLETGYGAVQAPNMPQHRHRLRDRSSAQPGAPSAPGRARYSGQGILPTPDPTVASCISDEDVARQLIALGDASNFSHGRTSASTLDDALSGAAEVASSTGATSESDDESDTGDRRVKPRKVTHDEHDEYDHMIKSEFDDDDGAPKTKKIKTKAYDGSLNTYRSSKPFSSKSARGGKARANTLPKLSKSSVHAGLMKAPTAPATPSQARKTSSSSTLTVTNPPAFDEEDLSTKPRCQRCRKSKKGCDRQRPCQRCKDAGIGVDGCISEDEGNGRKGRYGRHMGVPLKLATDVMTDDEGSPMPLSAGATLVGSDAGLDKSKKRKR